jgi:ribosomal protein S18 acetylase RimI-like enzyme
MSGNRKVSLRRGRTEDGREIAEIWHRGWRDAHLGLVPEELVEVRTEESFRARASERASEATVAVVGDAIAGFVMVVDDEVEQVYVSASHRGSGIADLLLTEAERQVRANGHAKAWLAVVPGNTRARSFYERAGWRDEGLFMHAAPTEQGPVATPCHRYTKSV